MPVSGRREQGTAKRPPKNGGLFAALRILVQEDGDLYSVHACENVLLVKGRSKRN